MTPTEYTPDTPKNHEGYPELTVEELIRERYTDELTGLHNLRWLKEFLPTILENDKTALLFMDLDGFKEINDTYGHAAGDEHLKKTATYLRRASDGRQGDEVIRKSGDEFLIVLRGIRNLQDLDVATQRIQKGVDAVGNGGSIGSVLHTGGETADELINRADQAMLIAKAIRKKAAFEALPRRKRVAAHVGSRLLRYAGINPPRQ